MESITLESFIDFCNDMEIVTEGAEYTKDKKYPVFLLLTHSGTPLANIIQGVTGDKFSHATMAFNPELEPMYSFGSKDGSATSLGFSVGTTKDGFYKKMRAYYRLYVMYVDEKEIKKMKSRLQYFIKNDDKLGYDLKGLFSIWFGKDTEHHKDAYFCSRFVMDVVGSGHHITELPSLYKPQDIVNLPDVTMVNAGSDLSKYDPKITKRNLEKLQHGTLKTPKLQY